MPTPFPNLPPDRRGTVHSLWYRSAALADNPWGDPAERDVLVYTPPGEHGPLPAILVLAPFSGTGEKLLARGLTELALSTRCDRLIAAGCAPFVAVLPDGMTRVVGSQYVDSPGIGRYATYVADELRALVASRFALSGRWGVAGRSSGGFGALHLALERPGTFHAVASHAGDMGFELCYLGDLSAAVAGFRALGGLDGFVDAFWSREDPPGSAFAAMNVLCMACAYAPDPGAAPVPCRLPVDPAAGTVDLDAFRAWGAFDPVVRAETRAARDALGALDLLLLDAGDRDEHHLQLGLRRLCAALDRGGVPFVHEEFPGGHRGTSHRWDWSLPRLAAALAR